MRLNRYISASGAASRRKGEDIIRDRRITVNGEIVTAPARNVDSECDKVLLDGILMAGIDLATIPVYIPPNPNTRSGPKIGDRSPPPEDLEGFAELTL